MKKEIKKIPFWVNARIRSKRWSQKESKYYPLTETFLIFKLPMEAKEMLNLLTGSFPKSTKDTISNGLIVAFY